MDVTKVEVWNVIGWNAIVVEGCNTTACAVWTGVASSLAFTGTCENQKHI